MHQKERERMAIELTMIVSLASITIGILGYSLNKQKQETEHQKTIKVEATRDAVIETKLDNISSGVENIRIDLRANERHVGEIDQRLTRVEESSKQAHKRIDKIKNEGE